MNRKTDFDDALLRRWMDQGTDAAPARFVQAALERIEMTPQRRWVLPRRLTMTLQKFAPFMGVAAASALLIAVGLVYFGGPRAPNLGGDVSPSPTATPSPTPRPTPEPCPTTDSSCTGPLAAGTHSTGRFSPSFSYTVPAGWRKSLDLPTAFNLESTDGSGGFIGVWPDFAAALVDECLKQQEPGVGQSATELIGWVAAHPGLVATTPEAVTIGGYAGQATTVEVDPAYDGPCEGEVSLFVATADDVGWVHVPDGEQATIAVVDTDDGHALTLWILADQAAFEAFVEAAQPVVDSFDFTP